MLVKIISATVGLLLLGALWWLGLRRLRSLRRAVLSEGVIIGMTPVESSTHPGRISHVPQLRYRKHDGTEQVASRVHSTFRLFKPEFKIGQTVRVAYDPETCRAEILQPAQTLRLWASLALFTAAVVGILLAVILA